MTLSLWDVDAETRVSAGGVWLDERYRNWWRAVPLSLELNMNNQYKCLLARVAGGSFYDLIPNVITTREALWCGFTGGYGVNAEQLRAAWIDLLILYGTAQATAVIREVFGSSVKT